ncbi:MAG: vanadium-dependent haloperoxidase [Saprospiraceae bacterium]|nr:vanadium-dependent haloperoxidase [Saprospiraceae bacterium]
MNIRTLLLAVIFTVMNLVSFGQAAKQKNFKPSLANKWLDIALEITANDVDRYGAKPTIQARQLGIAMTAMYDAWACYDAKAVNSLFAGKLRRPAAERTTKNKEKAISYAMLHVLIDQYPLDKKQILDEFQKMGYDPKNYSLDRTKPEGIGNLVAKELLKFRHNDGSNQLGNELGSDGKPYSDYTYYKPINTYKKVIDPDRWHPLPFVKNNGDTFLVNFLTPHWYRVKPFGLLSSSQFRAPEYPKVGSEQLKKEVDECIDFNANLDHTRKSTIEFMRDGPRSTGQAGHWLRFSQMVSQRDQNDLDRDVKLYFVVGTTAMDAFIACWETKRFYDSARPWTLVRHYYKGQQIKGWGGPDKGTQDITADRWHPYSPADFVSPPFPAYVSGHSTVSAACAKILELFTGSDHFGVTENRICGIITETPGDPVSLPLPTFTATAEMAGISRVLGGYHIQADNIEGLNMGRKIAHYLWSDVYQKYFDGTYKSKG